LENRRAEQILPWGADTSCGGKNVGGRLQYEYCIRQKMIPVEIPGMGESRIKENGERVNSIYLIYCKNLCKCHNVPLPSTTKNKRKK
jgi:hypothetical protein